MKKQVGILITLILVLGSGWLLVGGFSSGDDKDEALVVLSAPERNRRQAPRLKRISILPHNPDRQSVLSVQTEAMDLSHGPISYQYRWRVNRQVVAETKRLRLKKYRQGDVISVEVTPLDGKLEGVPVESAAVRIRNNRPSVLKVDLKPSHPKVGESVRASVQGFDSDDDMLLYDYQWHINGQYLEGNNSDRLAAGLLQSADRVSVIVTASDPYSEGLPVASQMVAVENKPPTIVSNPPSNVGKGEFVYQIRSEDPDKDLMSYALLKGPSDMVLDARSGQLTWKVLPLPQGKAEVAIEVSDGKWGKSLQRFTIHSN